MAVTLTDCIQNDYQLFFSQNSICHLHTHAKKVQGDIIQ